tara:strand:+ start:10 stop:1152 length:1143 start_codon:yes stop_codon:yes gene_type:complete
MKLPKLTNLSVTDAADGDAHFPKVEALLPFDGTNGATSTTDLSDRGNTVTFGGDAEISTAQSKFGGSSLSLDGNGDYVDLPQATNQLVSEDFTIEFWFRINSGAGSETIGLFGSYYTGGSGKGMLMVTSATYNQVYFQWHYGASDWAYLNQTQGTRTALSNNTWYHVAVTRSGSTWRLFLNGTQEDSVTQSSYITDSGSTTRLGNYGPSATASDGLNGYIEDFRITRGVARYTSNFTAPTSAHPTSTGDVNKVVVVNSSADGIRVGYDGTSNQRRVAKAWADIDGSQTAANQIESSYNISSMTDHGSSQFSFNFATAMADANYSVVGGLGLDGGSATSVATVLIKDKTTALVKVHTRYVNASGTSTDYDYNIVCIQVFGN